MTAEEYFLFKANKQKERADYHADMAQEGINPEYHLDMEARLREDEAKLTSRAKAARKRKKRPSKKDIGPMGAMTTATTV